MTIDGFLTFLGFLVAAYAVLNPITRLRLGLHSARQVVLSVLLFSAVMGLLFFDQIRASIPLEISERVDWLDKEINPDTIGPNKLAFLLILAWIGCSIALYKSTRPSSLAISRLRILLERLHDERRFLELVEISEPYLHIIDRAIKEELFLQKQHHQLKRRGHGRELDEFLASLSENPSTARPKEEKSVKERALDTLGRGSDRLARKLAHLLPARTRATSDARSIENLLLKSPGISETLAFVRPDISLKLSSMETATAEEFRTDLFRRMISDIHSRFYIEIELLQVTGGPGKYVNLKEAPFLGPIITDSELASRLNVSKCIGDEAIRLISHNRDYIKTLNKPCRDESEIWKDPVFCILQLFYHMISTAARQGKEDHMWLMYLSVIASQLEEAFDPSSPFIDPTSEFPTLGCRLLYEVTSNYQGWLRQSTSLPADNIHVSPSHFNGPVSASIPWSAAYDYAETIRIIVGSSRLPDRFRKDRWASYVRFVGDIPMNGNLALIRQRLISEAVQPSGYSAVGNVKHEIERLQDTIDPFIRYSCPDLDDALQKEN